MRSQGRDGSMTPIRIIDAHQHFWDLQHLHYPWLTDELIPDFRFGDYAAIRRNHLPADYRRSTSRYPVTMSVHMEAGRAEIDGLRETEWVSRLAGDYDLPNALIAHVALESADLDRKLAGHMQHDLFRGIRTNPAEGPSDVLGSRQWRDGLRELERRGLVCDLRLPATRLTEGARAIRALDSLQFVLNHGGFPTDRSGDALATWREGLAALAEHPNVSVKLSGLSVAGSGWRHPTQPRVVMDILETFGPRRCVFASNLPVESVASSYDEIVETLSELLAGFSEEERDDIFFANSLRIYRPIISTTDH
jgi:predicted TIM-barrel fold metal-dependent hydrolase